MSKKPGIKKVLQVFKSKPTMEGAGVSLYRAFGFNEIPRFDPFLLMDDFRGDKPADFESGFPWHPHRGIETITYVLEGEVEHSDSLGNKGVIGPGDVQWMTAGSGIIHQEMPKGNFQGRMGGFQLWANLPAVNKMMNPRYQEIVSGRIPVADLGNGVSAKVIAGEAAGIKGPVKDIIIDPLYLDVTIVPGGHFSLSVKKGHTAFAYVFGGQGLFGDSTAGANHNLLLFGEGDKIYVAAADTTLRFLFIAGRPLREPVEWSGPIVMNTREELQTAFNEYNTGTFIKAF